MSSKKNKKPRLQIKIMKGTKKLEIGTKNKHVATKKKTFLRCKNFASIAKKKSVEEHNPSGPS